MQVPLSSWGRLDASAPYEEFAEGGSSPQIISYVASFSPAIVMMVDWSALELYRRLKQRARDSKGLSLAPMVNLNYRVFSRTAIGDELNLVSGYGTSALCTYLFQIVDVTAYSSVMTTTLSPEIA